MQEHNTLYFFKLPPFNVFQCVGIPQKALVEEPVGGDSCYFKSLNLVLL